MADTNGISGSLLELADNVSALTSKVDAHGRQLEAVDRKLEDFAKGQTKASRWGAFFGAALAGAITVGLDHCSKVSTPTSTVQSSDAGVSQ